MNLTQLVHYFQSITPSTWHTFFVLLGSSVGVSMLLEVAKPYLKKLEAKYGMQAKRLIMVLLGFMSFAVSFAGDALQTFQQNPGLLGTRTAEVASIALAIYHFGGSNLYAKIRSFLQAVKAYLDSGSLPSGTTPAS